MSAKSIYLTAALVFLGALCVRSAPCAGQSRIRLKALNENGSATIGVGPGRYAFEGPLRVEIRTRTGGWFLSVRATDLTDGAKKIDAREVCLTAARDGEVATEDGPDWLSGGEEDEEGAGDPDPGRMVPLHKSRMLARGAKAGRTTLSISLGLRVRRSHPAGVYTGNLLVLAKRPGRPPQPPLHIPLRVTVRPSIEHSLDENQLTFTYRRTGEEPVEHLSGQIAADIPVWLTVCSPQGRVDRAVPENPDGPPIPLEWKLRENEREFRVPDVRGEGRIAWRLRGCPGDLSYTLQCTAKPRDLPPPGRYGADLKVKVLSVGEFEDTARN